MRKEASYYFIQVENMCQQSLRELWREEKLTSLAHVEMEEGAVSLLHRHHRTTELYFGLSGQGVIHVGEELLVLKRDSVVVIPAGMPHKVVNTGTEPLRHLVQCAPAFDVEDVEVREVSAWERGQEEVPAVILLRKAFPLRGDERNKRSRLYRGTCGPIAPPRGTWGCSSK